MLVGTYTQGVNASLNANSRGIYTYEIAQDCSVYDQLSVTCASNPSWLERHPNLPVVYAVSEIGEPDGGGSVHAYELKPDGMLQQLNNKTTMGEDPCHLTVDPNGRFLVVSNYSSGNFVTIPLTETGRLLDFESYIQHQGKGIDPMRQQHSHVHCARLDRSGKYVYMADLGVDQIIRYPVSSSGSVNAGQRKPIRLKPGAGPRHLCIDQTNRFFYVINELDSTIVALERLENNGLVQIATYSSIPVDCEEANYGAELCLSADGRFLYGSNRGHDSLVVFKVEDSGELETMQIIGSGGSHPRHFCLTPAGDYLFVANRNTDNIAIFSRDHETGLLSDTNRKISLPSPACIMFA